MHVDTPEHISVMSLLHLCRLRYSIKLKSSLTPESAVLAAHLHSLYQMLPQLRVCGL